MGKTVFEFEGKITNDFSMNISHLNSFIVPFVSCVVSKSI